MTEVLVLEAPIIRCALFGFEIYPYGITILDLTEGVKVQLLSSKMRQPKEVRKAVAKMQDAQAMLLVTYSNKRRKFRVLEELRYDFGFKQIWIFNSKR